MSADEDIEPVLLLLGVWISDPQEHTRHFFLILNKGKIKWWECWRLNIEDPCWDGSIGRRLENLDETTT